mgnify:FL=1
MCILFFAIMNYIEYLGEGGDWITKLFEYDLIKGDKLSGAIEEWLDIKDAWEEDIDQEIQPYRKRSENVKISDQSD